MEMSLLIVVLVWFCIPRKYFTSALDVFVLRRVFSAVTGRSNNSCLLLIFRIVPLLTCVANSSYLLADLWQFVYLDFPGIPSPSACLKEFLRHVPESLSSLAEGIWRPLIRGHAVSPCAELFLPLTD